MNKLDVWRSILAKRAYGLSPEYSDDAWAIYLYDIHYKIAHPRSIYGIFGKVRNIEKHKYFPHFIRFRQLCAIEGIDCRAYLNALTAHRNVWARKFPLPSMLISQRAMDCYASYKQTMRERYPTARMCRTMMIKIPEAIRDDLTTHRGQTQKPARIATKGIQGEIVNCLMFLWRQIENGSFDVDETLLFDFGYISPFVAYFVPAWSQAASVPQWKVTFELLDKTPAKRDMAARVIRKWFIKSEAWCWPVEIVSTFCHLFNPGITEK